MNKREFREIRGWILKTLYNNLPEWTGDKLLTDILVEGGYTISTPSVQGHLRYLSEKGYVEMREAEVTELGLSRVLAKLTSRGVDLVEGSIEDDPGIERK